MTTKHATLLDEHTGDNESPETDFNKFEENEDSCIVIHEDLKMTLMDFVRTFNETKDIIEVKGKLIDFIRGI